MKKVWKEIIIIILCMLVISLIYNNVNDNGNDRYVYSIFRLQLKQIRHDLHVIGREVERIKSEDGEFDEQFYNELSRLSINQMADSVDKLDNLNINFDMSLYYFYSYIDLLNSKYNSYGSIVVTDEDIECLETISKYQLDDIYENYDDYVYTDVNGRLKPSKKIVNIFNDLNMLCRKRKNGFLNRIEELTYNNDTPLYHAGVKRHEELIEIEKQMLEIFK